jgi:hypothetical protein
LRVRRRENGDALFLLGASLQWPRRSGTCHQAQKLSTSHALMSLRP